MPLTAAMWTLFLIWFVPYVLLTIGGIRLWSHFHTLPTLLVPLGFAVGALSVITGTFISVEFALMNHPGWRWIHFLGPIGLGIAAVGLVVAHGSKCALVP